MSHVSDRDGKSKTSSAVDFKHYPDMPGQEEDTQTPAGKKGKTAFSHSEIEERAHDLWVQAGYPDGTAEENWYEAERQVVEAHRDRTDGETMAAQAGSVQR